MAHGRLEAPLKLEAGADAEEAGDEAAAAAVPLVAERVAAESCGRPPKGMMRAVAFTLAAALAVAILLAVSVPKLWGGPQPGQHSADPPPGGVVDELIEEFAASRCQPVENGVDYLGGQGKAVANVPSQDACRAKCLAIPSCTMWTWVAGTGIPLTPMQCWVKSGVLKNKLMVLPGGKALSNYWSGCIQARISKVVPVSPYTLNFQADHAAGEPPGMGCGPPGPLPAVWTAAPRGGPSVEVSVLTYNLAWWMTFDHGRPGELYFHERTPGNTAMGLIKAAAAGKSLDVMAFQECNNIDWLLRTSGLASAFTGYQGPEGICLAFRNSKWNHLGQGQAVVAEDTKLEYWGRRMAQWMRLYHKASGKTVFFMNHHGPLPVSSGGVCGAPATVRRLLSMIVENAHPGEPVILVGDFNAERASQTIGLLKSHLNAVHAGTMHNGIDNIFSNLPPSSILARATLGSGGSDHNALHAKLRL